MASDNRQVRNVANGLPAPSGKDPRTAPRYDIERNVVVFDGATEPRHAVALNLSKLGVALRVGAPPPEHAHRAAFESGDQVIVQNLVDLPVECWVVAYSDNILRLRFVAGPAASMQIRKLVDGIAASVETGKAASVQPLRWRRKRYLAAAAAALVVVTGATMYGWFRNTPDVRKQLVDSGDGLSGSGRRAGQIAQQHRPDEPLGVIVNAEISAELPPGSAPLRQLFRIPAGSTIAVKVTGLDRSRTSGPVEAILDRDFYDAGDRSHVLLPQGSRFIGRLVQDPTTTTQTISWTSVELPGKKRIRFVPVSREKPANATDDSAAPFVSPDLDKTSDGHVLIYLRKDIALSPYSERPTPPR